MAFLTHSEPRSKSFPFSKVTISKAVLLKRFFSNQRVRDHPTCTKLIGNAKQIYKDVFNMSQSVICSMADNMQTNIAYGDSGGKN